MAAERAAMRTLIALTNAHSSRYLFGSEIWREIAPAPSAGGLDDCIQRADADARSVLPFRYRPHRLDLQAIGLSFRVGADALSFLG